MYPLLSCHQLACDSTRNTFFGCNYRGDLDIWKIPFKQTFIEFLKISHLKLSGDDFFVFCYWFCVFFAMLGFVEAVFEFIRLYSDDNYQPSTFWNRSYEHIPLEFQQRARLHGSVFNIISSFCLVYGLTNFRDIFFLPLIVSSVLVIGLEIIYWIIDGFSTKNFKLKPLKSILFLVFRCAIVIHVMIVIQKS